jgi:hypothetical protein
MLIACRPCDEIRCPLDFIEPFWNLFDLPMVIGIYILHLLPGHNRFLEILSLAQLEERKTVIEVTTIVDSIS